MKISCCRLTPQLIRQGVSAGLAIIFLFITVLVYAEVSEEGADKKNAAPVMDSPPPSPGDAALEIVPRKDVLPPVSNAAGTVKEALNAKDMETVTAPALKENPPVKVAVEKPAPAADSTTEKTQKKAGKPPKPEKIAMTSDKALINRENRTIELTGNVQVSQGNTVITSDTLKLFLKEGATLEAPRTDKEQSIQKVIANGNVEFKLDIGTAYSDHAEYHTDTKLLVLTGREPKFISGENTITGSKITVNRDDGTVTIEGTVNVEGDNQRVEAIIYSNDQL